MDADVVVIGAGASGLVAAESLSRTSLRVLVVEARDRVGGRVREGSPAASLTEADLGAEFIHGSAPETMRLLRAARMQAIPSDGESLTSDGHGGFTSSV